jgi:hypothetical protein
MVATLQLSHPQAALLVKKWWISYVHIPMPKICDINNLKEERFVLIHGFRALSMVAWMHELGQNITVVTECGRRTSSSSVLERKQRKT